MDIKKLASRVRARVVFAVLTVGTLAIALSPATAGAQQVTDAQYNSTLQLLQGGGQPPSPPSQTSEGGLPFTGLDVVALFAVGAVLALAGIVLWRRSRTTGEVRA